MSKGIKIAISGKGGVGKTTLSALLCHELTKRNKEVLAVDADPDANLGMALGFDPELLANVRTIAQAEELIAERTGSTPGSMGGWFTLNPYVADIPGQYIVKKGAVSLLQMGTKPAGGMGCACPESIFLKSLLNHIILDKDEAVIVDMEAGLEHLGRGTAEGVDAFIIVVEPGQRSLATANAIVKMAKDLGVEQIYAVISKLHGVPAASIAEALGNIRTIGVIPYNVNAVLSDWTGQSLFELCPEWLEEAAKIVDTLLAEKQKAAVVSE